MSSQGFGSGLWRQLHKVRIDADGTFRAPVKADGKSGIVLGDPPLIDVRRRHAPHADLHAGRVTLDRFKRVLARL